MRDDPYRTAATRPSEPKQLDPAVEVRLALDTADRPRGATVWIVGMLGLLGVASVVLEPLTAQSWVLAVLLFLPLMVALRRRWFLRRRREALLAAGFELEEQHAPPISAHDDPAVRVETEDVRTRIASMESEAFDEPSAQDETENEMKKRMLQR